MALWRHSGPRRHWAVDGLQRLRCDGQGEIWFSLCICYPPIAMGGIRPDSDGSAHADRLQTLQQTECCLSRHRGFGPLATSSVPDARLACYASLDSFRRTLVSAV